MDQHYFDTTFYLMRTAYTKTLFKRGRKQQAVDGIGDVQPTYWTRIDTFMAIIGLIWFTEFGSMKDREDPIAGGH